jgi:hypothetical protein
MRFLNASFDGLRRAYYYELVRKLIIYYLVLNIQVKHYLLNYFLSPIQVTVFFLPSRTSATIK